MPWTLTLPKLSPTMEEGALAKWHVKVGDQVKPGDVLMEVATDKAVVEYRALDPGWVRQLLVQEGQSAKVNQAIAILTVEKGESIEGYQPEGSAAQAEKAEEPMAVAVKGKSAKTKVVQESATAVAQQPAFMPEAPLARPEWSQPSGEGRVRASPLARRVAREKGLDLSTVRGSGPHGRVLERDLEKAQPEGLVAFGRQEVPTEAPGSYEEVTLSPMRKSIAKRLQEAKSWIPHFYVTQRVDAMALVALREQLAGQNIKITYNDCIVRACALCLRRHPEINSGYNSVNESIVNFKTIDIAVAVSVDGGLITPIIRYADHKNLGQLSLEMKELASRARASKLEPEEYRGGSFTISNLGMYGIEQFQAILNPPQAAILAVGGIQEEPVVKNGAVVPGRTMHLTLSADHRVIDGAAAAQFLNSLKQLLEQPAVLLV
jgi:pyruvate dehydrogenase E2 component (dihydrolipoamide acetyltransferase)